jgi:hypothetical protein
MGARWVSRTAGTALENKVVGPVGQSFCPAVPLTDTPQRGASDLEKLSVSGIARKRDAWA